MINNGGFRLKRSQHKLLTPCLIWRPQGDSNPCYRRERAVLPVDYISKFLNLLQIRSDLKVLLLILMLFTSGSVNACESHFSAFVGIGHDDGAFNYDDTDLRGDKFRSSKQAIAGLEYNQKLFSNHRNVFLRNVFLRYQYLHSSDRDNGLRSSFGDLNMYSVLGVINF